MEGKSLRDDELAFFWSTVKIAKISSMHIFTVLQDCLDSPPAALRVSVDRSTFKHSFFMVCERYWEISSE